MPNIELDLLVVLSLISNIFVKALTLVLIIFGSNIKGGWHDQIKIYTLGQPSLFAFTLPPEVKRPRSSAS